MPTYEYECSACGHRFEKFQSITAEAIRKCPACKRSKARRLIGSGGAILFKGSGFYAGRQGQVQERYPVQAREIRQGFRVVTPFTAVT